MEYVQIGVVRISRFILGSNPLSGFSHQSPEMDLMMKRYYTTARIKETIRTAERLGVNTLIGRTDYHIIRLLLEYWDEGGTIQWFAQTCPEARRHEMCVERAAAGGAKGCHIHGGVMDNLLAQGRLGEIAGVVAGIRERGMLAGIAGQVAFWGRMRQLPRRDALALGFAGCMATLLAHGLVDNTLFFPDLALTFFLILGLARGEPAPPTDMAAAG